MLRVIVRGKFPPGLNRLEDVSVRRMDFSVEMVSDFSALFKKDEKLSKPPTLSKVDRSG